MAGGDVASLDLAPLGAAFFARRPDEVAPDLLGTVIVRDLGGRDAVVAAIVETEAYGGPEDRASHARAGRTRRTEPMFGPPGRAYVYLVYGMHNCLNVVAHTDGVAGAVLIRAAMPVVGAAVMAERRRPARGTSVGTSAAGPARLCQALAISRAHDRVDLTAPGELWLASPSRHVLDAWLAPGIVTGPRIGVSYAGERWASLPWRYGVRGHPALSRPFPGGRTARASTGG